MRSLFSTLLLLVMSAISLLAQENKKIPAGFVSLFDGKNFTNWKVPKGDNGLEDRQWCD
jgi:hypothetical protein